MSDDSSPPDHDGAWFANFGQISIGAADLGRAIAFWEQQVGIGPWTVFRGLFMDALHEGQPIHMAFDVGLCWHDGRLIELIQAIGDGPSPLHDGLNRATAGLQRLASLTADIERDAALAEARGMIRITAGEAGGQRFIHYRSNEAPGLVLELLERTPAFERMLDQLQRRAAHYRSSRSLAQAAAPIAPAPLPTMMAAALIDGYGAADRFRIAKVPVPVPGPGQVVIRVAGAAVNPVDVKTRKGALDDVITIEFPARLGGDVAGVVASVGSGVTGLAVGDRVAGMIDPFRDGAYAEYVAAFAESLVRVPDSVDLVAAAAVPTGVLTGTQLVEVGVMPKVGERVLVTGAGGSTGRAAVVALLAAGAIPIAGVRASSAAAVTDLGVAVVDLGDADADAVAQAGPYDAIADTVGGPLVEQLFALVRPEGIVASIAVPMPIPPAGSTQQFCAVIVRFDGEQLKKAFAGIANGTLSVPVARVLPLADVALAHQLMEQGGVGGKIILQP